MGYVIIDNETKAINKALIKWGEFPVSSDGVRGTVLIKKYRKYNYSEEVDIQFKGEIHAKIGKSRGWHNSDILSDNNLRVSKIKLNRFLRKFLLSETKSRMAYFGVNLNWYTNIKNIKWL